MYSLLSALFAVFLYFNPLSSTSPYETAEHFVSYDRQIDSWENTELFESLGTDLDLSMDRVVHDTPIQTYWTDVTVEGETFEGYSSMMVQDAI